MNATRIVIVFKNNSGEVTYGILCEGIITRRKVWIVPVSCQNWIEEGKVISVKRRYTKTCDEDLEIDIHDELEKLEDDSRFCVKNMEDVDQEILEKIYLAQQKLREE